MQFDCSGLCRAKYLKDVKLHKKVCWITIYTSTGETQKPLCKTNSIRGKMKLSGKYLINRRFVGGWLAIAIKCLLSELKAGIFFPFVSKLKPLPRMNDSWSCFVISFETHNVAGKSLSGARKISCRAFGFDYFWKKGPRIVHSRVIGRVWEAFESVSAALLFQGYDNINSCNYRFVRILMSWVASASWKAFRRSSAPTRRKDFHVIKLQQLPEFWDRPTEWCAYYDWWRQKERRQKCKVKYFKNLSIKFPPTINGKICDLFSGRHQ